MTLEEIIEIKDRFSAKYLGYHGIFAVGVGKTKAGNDCIRVHGTEIKPAQLPSRFEGIEVEYEVGEMPVVL